MITVSVLLIFLGSFALYNTSKKAILQHNLTIEKWFQNNTSKAKIIGVFCLLIAFYCFVRQLSITSAIMFWLVAVMSIMSLLVVLYPLKQVSYRYLTILFVVLFLIECFN